MGCKIDDLNIFDSTYDAFTQPIASMSSCDSSLSNEYKLE
jgi:hypothetical protein